MRACTLMIVLGACTADVPKQCPSRGALDATVFVSVDLDTSDPVPYCMDKYPASRLDATASGPGRDESYAASQPGVIPWTDVTLEEASLACGRGGKFVCEANLLVATSAFLDTAINPDPYTYALALRPIEDYEVPPLEQLAPLAYGTSPSVPLPESSGSLIYLTSDRKLVGSIVGDKVRHDRKKQPLPIPAFHHPLVGFRCCIDARLHDIFEPLAADPRYVRSEEPVVPVQSGGN